MQEYIAGWDIGGAHLKAALVGKGGQVAGVYQQSCEMWKGLDKLISAAQHIVHNMPLCPNSHVLTMTGELADIFSSREEGVREILATMRRLLPENESAVYAGKDGFIWLNEVTSDHFTSIASANWLASATLAAQRFGNGLFVDIGSTTTDILVFGGGKVLAEGYSDYGRLISQELVYTGVVRTPVMAVAHSVQDCGQEVGLMAEYFAAMADVYRLTGELEEHYDQTPTADGADKTVSASARRLARMFGCDYYENQLSRWQEIARQFRDRQLERMQSACNRQLTRARLAADAPVIGAGVGKFLVKELAQNLGRPYFDFSGLFSGRQTKAGLAPADCAPAVAVAALYLKD